MKIRPIAIVAGMAALMQATSPMVLAQDNPPAESLMLVTAVCMSRTSSSRDPRQVIIAVPAERKVGMEERGFALRDCDNQPGWFADFKAKACQRAAIIPASFGKLLAVEDGVSPSEICSLANAAAQ